MDYILKLKRLCNNLATIDEPVSWHGHLIYMPGGLDQEYNVFVTSINNRPDFPSIEEMHSLCLIYEFRLEQQHSTTQHIPLQANVVAFHQNKRFHKPSHLQSYNNKSFSQFSFSHNNQPHSSFSPHNSQYDIFGKPLVPPFHGQWKPKANF